MAWFHNYGWVVPLTFLMVFLSVFLLHRRSFSFYRCGHPDREIYGLDGYDRRTKVRRVRDLEEELNEMKRQYQGVSFEDLEKKIRDLKTEL
ncbi:hypothetical protein SAMN05920897_1353 [Alkalispirochaeta americana]|uniref:Uncharacterized protein n=1 Tax=Alkalispirochaeta americana TaxID=159291 RepID=A0A1N6XZP6_9SPIO|nr:hypothetical protein [Alkalispirochaeta americana]SIR07756.1 hypothetical protein SAMN05920897_1353 [Alkalispirochaeta americana]